MNAYITFSKEQKQKPLLPDSEIKGKLEKMRGIDYIVSKHIHYIINDPEEFEVKPDCEISVKLGRALEQQGNVGIIYV